MSSIKSLFYLELFFNSSKNFLSSLLNSTFSSKSGLFVYVTRKDSCRRHFAILAWSPESSTSGTLRPIYSRGFVYCDILEVHYKKESVGADSPEPNTPGSILDTASITTIAGSSPPVNT